MRTTLSLVPLLSLVIVLCVAGCGNSQSSVAGPSDPINAVVGDQSWYALQDSRVPAGREVDRIVTHLRWVESQLRATPANHLSPSQRDNRLARLDDLRRYRLAARFPQHSPGSSSTASEADRGPRWVDAAGRHCAVAFLVATSGRADLVEQVQRDHEYDYVPDIDDPELASWAQTHGFTGRELAMIQPTYDFQKEKPMTAAHLRSTLDGTTSVLPDCVSEAGEWTMKVVVSVEGDLEPKVVVALKRDGEKLREYETAQCVAGKLKNHVARSLRALYVTNDQNVEITETLTARMVSPDEARRRYFDRDTSKDASTCLSRFAGDAKDPVWVHLQVRPTGQVVFIGSSDEKYGNSRLQTCLSGVLSRPPLDVLLTKHLDIQARLKSDGTLTLHESKAFER